MNCRGIIITALLVAFAAVSANASAGSWYSAVAGNAQAGGCKVVAGRHPSAGAWAWYAQDMNTTGWAKINVITNSKGFSDADQAYLAGCVEGAITQDLIWSAWPSLLWTKYGDSGQIPAGVSNWMNANDQWVLSQIRANPTSNFWKHVGLLYTQLAGMIDGYTVAAPASQKLPRLAFLMMSGDGDLGDINDIAIEGFKPSRRNRGHHDQNYGDHCSALIKLTDDYGELFAGHTSWASYAYMLRMYKSYVLNFNSVTQASKQVQFAGYPGALTSNDDWYLSSAQLMVTETTNGFYNTSLNSLITPSSLLTWMRAGVATRIANSGQEWTTLFSQYNSGTYCNQWMVVDYKLFTPYQAPLRPGLLWIAEQMPGRVESGDKTHVLALGYWPSYNVPYFESVYAQSGFADMAKQKGIGYTWELAPRAKLFRRDHGNVKDLSSMMSMMRSNNYVNDPFSAGSPMRAISSRGDLPYINSPKPHKVKAFGGIDSKVTSYALMQSLGAMAQNGPTHDQVPPFSWAQKPEVPHIGQPEVFNFDYEAMQFPSQF